MTKEYDNDDLFKHYALNAFYKEIIERALSNLTFVKCPEEVHRIVNTAFTNIGQPGLFKLKKLDDQQVVTFGESLRYSFSKKILEIVRHQGSTHSAYYDKKVIFNDTQHILYLIDTEELEDKNAQALNHLLLDFSQEVNNWMNGHLYKTEI